MNNPLSIIPDRLRRGISRGWNGLSEMDREMDRWFQSSPRWLEAYEKFEFSPSCDLTETPKEYLVRFDIPGVKKEDVKIEIDQNCLFVSGERKATKTEDDARQYVSESFYGSFSRSFNLPTLVDGDKIQAHYEDGVLSIKIPKLTTSKPKAVKIQ